MNKKFLLAGMILAVLIISLVSAGWFNERLSPNSPSTSESAKTVNAHACNADMTCEINYIDAGSAKIGYVTLGSEGISTSTGMLVLDSQSGEIGVEGNLRVTGNMIVDGYLGMECAVFDLVGSGVQTCSNQGYDSCIVQEIKKTTTYHNSLNGSCSGGIQVKMENNVLASCTNSSGSGGGGCGMNNIGVEPYYGDISSGSSSQGVKVLCCR